MLEKIFNKLDGKKKIENLVIFLILAIITIIVINNLFSTDDSHTQTSLNVVQHVENISNNNTLENELKNILSKISGAGSVDVMVSYESEIENVPMSDSKTTITTVSEKDKEGGERKTEETSKEETIIYEEEGSNKTPALKQKILPKVIGVIVVAEGAYNQIVKENIINAVGAVIDIPSHRIQVFEKGK